MTAINALVLSDRVVLATDTSLYDHTGRVIGFGSKVVALPHLRMAIACRGPYAWVGVAASEIGADFESFDDFTQDGGEYLRDLYDENFSIFANGESEFDMCIVGWKERSNKPAAYVVSSMDHEDGERGLKGSGAFTLARRSFICAPSLRHDPAADLKGREGPQDEEWAADYLVSLMERQRLQKWPLGSGAEEKGYIVGGAATATVITAGGVSQKIVRRWPDRVDSWICPEGAEADEAA